MWKNQLSGERLRLQRLLQEEGPQYVVENSFALEKCVFVTAYLMRKLADADALTRDVTESRWPAQCFPCTVPPPHRHWFAISEDGKTWRQPLEHHYDLGNPMPISLSFREICDRLIHHFAFDVRYVRETDRIEIIFNSDHTTDKLYLVELSGYLDLVHEVAADAVGWVDANIAEGRIIQRRRGD